LSISPSEAFDLMQKRTMLSLTSALSLTLFVTLATASPPSPRTQWDRLASNQKFTLEQVAIERKTPWTHDLRRAYLKYGHKTPAYIEEAIKYYDALDQSTASTALPNGTTTTIDAKPLFADMEYVIDVKVGGLNLSLNLDTGSADL
jgi:hypothetical protein